MELPDQESSVNAGGATAIAMILGDMPRFAAVTGKHSDYFLKGRGHFSRVPDSAAMRENIGILAIPAEENQSSSPCLKKIIS